MFNRLSGISLTTSIPAGLLLTFTLLTSAQQVSRAPAPADNSDHRFESVHEDWSTPAMNTTHLIPVHALRGFVDEKPLYTVEFFRLQWRWGDPIDVYVMRPKGAKKPPVIVYLNGYPTDEDIFRNDVYEDLVAGRGVAAVGFLSALTGTRYHDRPMKEWFLSELQESLATSAHDVQMVLNYLESRGDLDMDRVGMFTQGSGASIAILASAVDPRIKVLEALDPWGDWPTWLATSPFVPEDERPQYVKPEFLRKVATLDPLEWLPKIQAKKFRLDTELFDTVTPKAVQEKLRVAAPAGSSVMLYKDMDEFKAAFQDGKNLEWIQHELQSLATPEARTALPSRKLEK
jgi:hypothetical protein